MRQSVVYRGTQRVSGDTTKELRHEQAALSCASSRRPTKRL